MYKGNMKMQSIPKHNAELSDNSIYNRINIQHLTDILCSKNLDAKIVGHIFEMSDDMTIKYLDGNKICNVKKGDLVKINSIKRGKVYEIVKVKYELDENIEKEPILTKETTEYDNDGYVDFHIGFRDKGECIKSDKVDVNKYILLSKRILSKTNPLDISNWDTSNWDTSNVKKIEDIFHSTPLLYDPTRCFTLTPSTLDFKGRFDNLYEFEKDIKERGYKGYMAFVKSTNKHYVVSDPEKLQYEPLT